MLKVEGNDKEKARRFPTRTLTVDGGAGGPGAMKATVEASSLLATTAS
jgi:hypothetical protein